MQCLTDTFIRSADRYSSIVSFKKTEVLFQPKPDSLNAESQVPIKDQPLGEGLLLGKRLQQRWYHRCQNYITHQQSECCICPACPMPVVQPHCVTRHKDQRLTFNRFVHPAIRLRDLDARLSQCAKLGQFPCEMPVENFEHSLARQCPEHRSLVWTEPKPT